MDQVTEKGQSYKDGVLPPLLSCSDFDDTPLRDQQSPNLMSQSSNGFTVSVVLFTSPLFSSRPLGPLTWRWAGTRTALPEENFWSTSGSHRAGTIALFTGRNRVVEQDSSFVWLKKKIKQVTGASEGFPCQLWESAQWPHRRAYRRAFSQQGLSGTLSPGDCTQCQADYTITYTL